MNDGEEIKQFDLDIRFVCKSFNINQIGGKYYCMPGDKAETDPKTGNEEAIDCVYSFYDNPSNLESKK